MGIFICLDVSILAAYIMNSVSFWKFVPSESKSRCMTSLNFINMSVKL